jgi:hypothetical protein
MKRIAILGFCQLAACGPSFTPATLVQGLRILAIKAEPPEVSPGQVTSLKALATDTNGRSIETAWAACTLRPAPGTLDLNPDCINAETAPYLLALGSGISLSAVVPDVSPADFGPPDASGGLYLPVRARTQAGADRVDSIYPLRLSTGLPPNHNPQLTGVLIVPPTGVPIPLDEASPVEVRAGQAITLRAPFSPDSAEIYQAVGAGQSGTLREILRVSWFATGGSFSEANTGEAKPDTIWRADQFLPPTGATIDLYVVGREERGGTDFLHRSFVLR